MTREEAIKRLKEYAQYSCGIWHNDEEDTKAFDMAIEALREISILAKPSNTVEVVRCKDCRWFDKGENEVDSWRYCTRVGNEHDTQGEWYCSWGERRKP